MAKVEENKKNLAKLILDKVGGKRNIIQASHCYTRLRLTLKEISNINTDELKSIDGVLGVVVRDKEYQIIIGPDVGTVYQTFSNMLDADVNIAEPAKVSKTEEKTKNRFTAILDFIGGTFSPIIPVLIAGGLTGAVLTILTKFFGVSVDSGTYKVFFALNQTAFYFLPIFIGFTAAKKLNINPYLGAMLGAFLLFSTINGAKDLSFMGIPIQSVTYSTTVFPIILGIVVMAPIYNFLNRIIPPQLKTIFLPLLTMIIIAPITLIVLGPIGGIVGKYLASGVYSLYQLSPPIAVMIIGIATPLMVFFGMNNALYPIIFALFDAAKCDPLVIAGMLAANVSVGAACLAVGYKTKHIDRKGVAISAGITGLMGISEPGVYGVLFPYKTPLIGAMVGGCIGGLLAGILKIASYAIASPSFISLPMFISNDGTITGLYKAIVVAIISSVIAFIVTHTMYKENDVKIA